MKKRDKVKSSLIIQFTWIIFVSFLISMLIALFCTAIMRWAGIDFRAFNTILIMLLGFAVSLILGTFFAVLFFKRSVDLADNLKVALRKISIFIGIYLITVSNFNIDRLKKQQKLFLIITFIAIFGSFLTWLVTFYSYFIYSNYIKYILIIKEKHNKESVINITDCSIEDKAEYLAKEISKLEKQKNKGEISEEKFLKLKSDLINKFL